MRHDCLESADKRLSVTSFNSFCFVTFLRIIFNLFIFTAKLIQQQVVNMVRRKSPCKESLTFQSPPASSESIWGLVETALRPWYLHTNYWLCLQSFKQHKASANISYLRCRGSWWGCCTCSLPRPRLGNDLGCAQQSTLLHAGHPGSACWSEGSPHPGTPTEKNTSYMYNNAALETKCCRWFLFCLHRQ